MSTALDTVDIFHRGNENLSSLHGAERLVFMLQDFDLLMEMEGWDHFFIYDHYFAWYSEFKEWLNTIDDRRSLAVLEDYERHLVDRGISLLPEAIDEFLSLQDDAYLNSCPDWREQFLELTKYRWARARAYLRGEGLELAE